MILENNYLLIEASISGAELTRIYDKEKKQDLLWEGNPLYWKRHSPILFPNVGKTYQNTVLINGASYPTSQHGFARDMDFVCTSLKEHSMTFCLKHTKETLQRYPFAFELSITYTLIDKSIQVTWSVFNPEEENMYFTIGGHPAFRFSEPFCAKSDYLLYFPHKNNLSYYLVDPSCGCADTTSAYSLTLTDSYYPLSESLFEKDALIFDEQQIEEVWICKKDKTPYIGMRCPGFSNFGIWSVKDAPFVCLEPWAGRCDNVGFSSELSEKPFVNTLLSGQTFTKSYEILIP